MLDRAMAPETIEPDLTVADLTVADETTEGRLVQADCLVWLPTLPEAAVDLVFADPPYNLTKAYWDTFVSQ